MKTVSSTSKRISLIVIFLFLILALLPVKISAAPSMQEESSPLANQTWVRLGGPPGGIGYDIKVSYSNPDIWYVTDTFAGIHRSDDSGLTWANYDEGIDVRFGQSGDAVPVFCVTVDPNDPNIIWVGLIGRRGVYRSADGGKTWERRVNGIVETNGITIRGISVEPGNSNIVYAAGELNSIAWSGRSQVGIEFDQVKGVVYKSIDGGLSWKAVWRGDNLARYLLIDPTNIDTLYVSTGIFDREAANSNPEEKTPGGVGVLKSTDGGETWSAVNNGLINLYIGSLSMHPTNSQILLAGTGNATYIDGQGIYLTINGGNDWNLVGGADTMITSVEIVPENPYIAYAAGLTKFYRSDDAGNTWRALLRKNGDWWGPEGIRPGFPIDIQVDPRNPERIFVNNYAGGNFLSEDGGENWVSASNGYTGAELTDVFVDHVNPAVVFVNGLSGPYISVNGGVDWKGLNSKNLPRGSQIEADPQNLNHIIMTTAHWGWVYESFDKGDSWNLVNDLTEELDALNVPFLKYRHQGFQALTFSPSNPKIVYGGIGVQSCATDASPEFCSVETVANVLTSDDGGGHWTQMEGTVLDGLSVMDIVVHPTDSRIAWVATGGQGVFQTMDNGKTWAQVSSGLGEKIVIALLGDSATPDLLYAGTATNGVYVSKNGGNTWLSSSTGMDPNEPIWALAIDPKHRNVIYAGSIRSGVYFSIDSGKTWNLINEGLSTKSINALAVSEDGETIYAATAGGGLFRLSTHDQSYFDALVPTPISPTAAPTISATETPIIITPTLTLGRPVEEESPASLFYISIAIVLLIGFVFVLRRKSK